MTIATTPNPNFLRILAEGILSMEDKYGGGSASAVDVRQQMVVDYGLFLNREGWVPLNQADHGYIEGEFVFLSRLGSWMSLFAKVDVEGMTLTFDREGTIPLRKL